jgi:alpha-L-fucosidase
MNNTAGSWTPVLLAAAALASASAVDVPGVRLLPGDSLGVLAAKAASVIPSARQLAWQSLEFQAFAHFGMNTFTDREWGEGSEDPRLFNPTDFDAGQWAEAFRAAGMKGLIVTAKHHDGFCLWPSRLTDHSVARSPWRGGRGDVVGEVAAACRKAGLKFGVYLSPWDRHEPSYGDSPRYNAHFLGQLRELLTGYGEISEVWFDGACGEGPNGKRQVYDWAGYWALIRKLQPRAVISIMGPDVRWIGNEGGVARAAEWSVIPLSRLSDRPAEKDPGGIAGLDAQAADLGSMKKIAETARAGGRLVWYPGQVDVSIRPGWFCHPAEDDRVKPLDKLLEIYFTSVGGNAQLLLNVPPDKRGRIHENDVLRLRELGEAIRAAFADNVAAGAKATASSTLEGGGFHAPAAVLDGDPATSWTPAAGDEAAWLEFDLSGNHEFNTLMIREDIRFGQRVEAFAVEAWNGNAWREVVRTTTIGYRRLLRFPAVKASRVRVMFLDVRASPVISEFGLYRDPSRSISTVAAE